MPVAPQPPSEAEIAEKNQTIDNIFETLGVGGYPQESLLQARASLNGLTPNNLNTVQETLKTELGKKPEISVVSNGDGSAPPTIVPVPTPTEVYAGAAVQSAENIHAFLSNKTPGTPVSKITDAFQALAKAPQASEGMKLAAESLVGYRDSVVLSDGLDLARGYNGLKQQHSIIPSAAAAELPNHGIAPAAATPAVVQAAAPVQSAAPAHAAPVQKAPHPHILAAQAASSESNTLLERAMDANGLGTLKDRAIEANGIYHKQLAGHNTTGGINVSVQTEQLPKVRERLARNIHHTMQDVNLPHGEIGQYQDALKKLGYQDEHGQLLPIKGAAFDAKAAAQDPVIRAQYAADNFGNQLAQGKTHGVSAHQDQDHRTTFLVKGDLSKMTGQELAAIGEGTHHANSTHHGQNTAHDNDAEKLNRDYAIKHGIPTASAGASATAPKATPAVKPIPKMPAGITLA